MKFILGQKLEMSQIFNEKGEVIPVTLIEAGPCKVLQVKNKEKDGYEAVQLGFVKKIKNIKKTEKGKEFKYLKEFKNGQDLKLGQDVDISIFKEGDKVRISGVSKGKGFQGAVKRWGFKERGFAHGVKHESRTLGSVGCRYPQHVIKGKKMAGHMGFARITVRNLKIAKIDKENNILAVKGAVPGRRGTLLEIKE
jgi:large subunit ribosomal protein L3